MPRLIAMLLVLAIPALALGQPLQTTAEATNFAKTTLSADVIKFCEALAKQNPKTVRYSSYGSSHDGKPLALLTIADAAETPKPAVLIFANIHAGEVDGKEAVLALARELAGEKGDALRKVLAILIAPNINPDGNDKLGTHRPEQNGPKEVGIRENAQGLDLNRDWVKLETAEIRNLVKLINERDPLVIVDCHTTNGSKHRYKLTYDGPRYAAADAELVAYSINKLMPAIAASMKTASGLDSFYYGNFAADHTKWETYPTTPRYSTQYFAMRNRFGILSESYSYASFEERIKASKAFCQAILDVTAKNLDAMKKIAAEAEKPKPRVVLKTKLTAFDKPDVVLGFTKEGSPKDYDLKFIGKSVPVLEVPRPVAYLFEKDTSEVVTSDMSKKIMQTLLRHGIVVESICEDLKKMPLEIFNIGGENIGGGFPQLTKRGLQTYKKNINAGTYLIRTEQPLGNLAAYLLERNAEDGFAAWQFFSVTSGILSFSEFSMHRVTTSAIFSTPITLPQDKKEKKPIMPEMLFGGASIGGGAGRRGGAGFGDITWLDGEHWLQSKGGVLQKVNALTGEATPAFDVAAFRKSLSSVPGLQRQQVEALIRGSGLRTDPQRTGTLIEAKGDLWFARFDGQAALQLTKTPGEREFVTFSPQGTHIAFVRGGNIFAVEIATLKETQLTTDGGVNEILNGRGDWVYEEEIFNRNGQTYWWSPNGASIAYLHFDDTPVKKFTIAKPFPARGEAEVYGYPKPGDPNPIVKLGVVNIADPKPTYLNLGDRDPKDTLISRVGWTPKNEVYAYIQNRVQTWLDFVIWKDGKPTTLFRDSTKAWIDDAGEPKFLENGSFLFLSERDGHKHIYHYDADGKLIQQVTQGNWDVKEIHRYQQKLSDHHGIVFSATSGSPNGSNLLVASVVLSTVPRSPHQLEYVFRNITNDQGTNTISIAPTGDLFVDKFSDSTTPAKTTLRRLNGEIVRKLDTNPVNALDDYKLGKYERTQITLDDGFKLEAAIIYPPDFDPAKKYPVWLRTYAGPHTPTIHDAFSTHLFEQVLAGMGIVVLDVDPRSASGHGAVTAWTCYKHLGVQELKDLEGAVDWIEKNKWCDATRIGISGHSYGGYITAYALTHSTKFSAGIAGAPVTDWRLYDSIYTERYMGLPDENKKGYDESSCVLAAKNLHGQLLILHGLIDDNVHFQNTMQFVDALQKANKKFELMVYPRARHPIFGRHYQEMQIDFIKKTMLK